VVNATPAKDLFKPITFVVLLFVLGCPFDICWVPDGCLTPGHVQQVATRPPNTP
jgi:hypothetical protein